MEASNLKNLTQSKSERVSRPIQLYEETDSTIYKSYPHLSPLIARGVRAKGMVQYNDFMQFCNDFIYAVPSI